MFRDVITIIIASAGEPDHLPRSHVLIAAVERICKIAFLGIEKELFEECFCVNLIELYLALLVRSTLLS